MTNTWESHWAAELLARKRLGGLAPLILARMILIIFACEFAVAVALSWPNLTGGLRLALMDTFLDGVLAAAPLYWLVVRPVTRLTARAAVAPAEARFQAVVRAVQDAILVTDPEGMILFCNPAVQPLFGYDPRDLNGQHVAVLLPGRELGRGESGEYARVVTEGLGERDTVEGKRRDGTRFPLEVSTWPGWADGQQFQVVILRDITERKRLQLLESFLPVCCVCGKVRDDTGGERGQGPWRSLEEFVIDHSDAQLSHTFCPGCYRTYRRDQGLAPDEPPAGKS